MSDDRQVQPHKGDKLPPCGTHGLSLAPGGDFTHGRVHRDFSLLHDFEVVMGRRLPGGTQGSPVRAQAVDVALDFGPDPVGVRSVLAVNETTTHQENKGQTQLQK